MELKCHLINKKRSVFENAYGESAGTHITLLLDYTPEIHNKIYFRLGLCNLISIDVKVENSSDYVETEASLSHQYLMIFSVDKLPVCKNIHNGFLSKYKKKKILRFSMVLDVEYEKFPFEPSNDITIYI